MNWNLKDIFKTEEEFKNAKLQIEEKLEKIEAFKGKLCSSANNLFECYNLYEKLLEIYERFYSYGMLSYHLNMADDKNIKLFKTVEKVGAEFERRAAFITPEITKIEDEKILSFIKEDPRLERYRRELEEIIKDKKHILSKEEEEILANYSEIFSSMENTFDVLTNTEFKFGKIKMRNGEEIELTDSNYTYYLKDKDENIRKQAFSLMYNKYSEFIHTIGELYITKVKASTITSRLRKYTSSLDRAVDNDDATIKVYNSLINAVHKNINVNHDFMRIKKELLKKDEMHLYDIYVNPIETEEDNISFEDAKVEVLDALSIMGEEYINKLKEAFNNNWIDVYEKPNKRSGAYSMGVYGVHPFVLTNFVNKKRDVSTIADELGHSMHSFYSNSNQNVIDANYTIMVAEIASTTNEILLASYQISNEKDETKKKELIYELLEMFRATFFRQAMFAEFEKIVHSKIEANEMLTPEDLNKIYFKLNEQYFGKDVVIDKQIQYEWARIPHFYTPFYVYKYATGVSAAVVIAKNILEKKPRICRKILRYVKTRLYKKIC